MTNLFIHNIYFCSYTDDILSGGEKFAFKIIPYLAERYPNICYIGYSSLTTKWSKENKNIRAVNLFPRPKIIKGKLKKLLTFVFYFVVFLKSLKWIKKFKLGSKNVIISLSDAWPDTLFAFLLKLCNKDAYWIAINHMVLPSPFKGYKYVYIKKYKIPSFVDLYQWLNQRIFFLLQKKANLLVSINSDDRKYLLKKNKNVQIIRHGREYTGQPELDLNNKIYDICFLGRFYEQKGIDEIPDILSNLKRIYNEKLSVIFIGPENNYSNWLKKELELKNLSYNIKFLGPKYNSEKYDLLKKSKLLLFSSNFESFGIVYLDAISVGTPVVEYNLPCFVDHKAGVLKTPYKNNRAFAENIKRLLLDNNLYKKLSLEGYKYSKEFSWEKTAEAFEKYFDKYMRSQI